MFNLHKYTTVVTPSGRSLGRLHPTPDPRDYRYSKMYRCHARAPQQMDLSGKLPPCWDQGRDSLGAPHALAGLACALWPDLAPTGPSLQFIYWLMRHYSKLDEGEEVVVTRDLMRAGRDYGFVAEDVWPTAVSSAFTLTPLPSVIEQATQRKLGSYAKLVQTASYLDCLASGFPFILGFEAYSSLDSDGVAKTGVMPIPDPKTERVMGGCVALVVGYDLNFTASEAYKNSGLSRTQVSDRALKVRNSWGSSWGDSGHFWMPFEFATDPATGGDAWTGRREIITPTLS